ncbi:hypothetical protein [Stackebrandtia nassauensis]|uniref:Ig-like domain-containing protein n=1 Tax=Stackebrandtia nassauensis (strain DSM 44728 / CIP 108903 / NRRL B-16338 / NBRC 102104 / LLR-40K-21) TaxID=446470 RepID=D3QBM9_STANL|nr:hypothetical protein [Stackebrandtia nassauensis]ADD42911.1 hypothetical protein Snas_3241 [Stackebrandtia nassauensis DSM 44728]
MRRFLIPLSLAFAVIAMPTPAFAAVPGNDEPAGAVDLGSLPAAVTQDTTEATYTPHGGCTSGDAGANVWYTLTVDADQRVVVDTAGSDYNTGLNVFAGDPDTGGFVGCSERNLRFDGFSGVTYYIEIAACCGSSTGGQLALSVSQAPEPPAVSVTVDPNGQFDTAGRATITGTASCAATVQFASVEVFVSQRVGRVIITGQNGANLDCEPGGAEVPWSVTVTGGNGLYRGGQATASVQSVGCNTSECASNFTEAAVRLRR